MAGFHSLGPVLLLLVVIFPAVFCTTNCRPESPCTPTHWACHCTQMTLLGVYTDPKQNATLISISISHACSQRLHYVEFGLSDPITGRELQFVNTVRMFSLMDSAFYPKVIEDTNRTSNLPSKVLRFINSPSIGKSGMTSEILSFLVTGYYPTFSHYWTSHFDDKFESHGPMNMWLCPCPDCDSAIVTRTTSRCNLGYSFLRNPTTYFHPRLLWAAGVQNSKQLSVFYVHNSPLNLGYSKTIIGNETVEHPINITSDVPRCVDWGLRVGSQSLDASDPTRATDREGRPIFPSVFLTEYQEDKDYKRGDWQQGGSPIPPSGICGIWKTSTKRILTNGFSDQVDPSDAAMNLEGSEGRSACRYDTAWEYGAGAPTLPWSWSTNWRPWDCDSQYGAVLTWNLDDLNMKPESTYRLQIMVHSTSRDNNSNFDEAAQQCINIHQHCPPGYASDPNSSIPCQSCQDKPAPYDGTYSWFCFPSDNRTLGYQLLKIPTELLSSYPYSQYGFRPKMGMRDSEGYLINCGCERVHVACPFDCSGNGICDSSTGKCQCNQSFGVSLNRTTCSIENNSSGKECPGNCSGNGICLDGKCQCVGYWGDQCQHAAINRSQCSELGATDCSQCMDEARARGIWCRWCPSLGNKGCVRNWDECPSTNDSLAMTSACYPTIEIPIPQCLDGCMGSGTCINVSDCTNGTVKCDKDNLEFAIANNHSKLCLCSMTYTRTYLGLNCGRGVQVIIKPTWNTTDWVRTRSTGGIVGLCIFGACMLLGLAHVLIAVKLGKNQDDSTTALVGGVDELNQDDVPLDIEENSS